MTARLLALLATLSLTAADTAVIRKERQAAQVDAGGRVEVAAPEKAAPKRVNATVSNKLIQVGEHSHDLASVKRAAAMALDEAFDHQSTNAFAIETLSQHIWTDFVNRIGEGMPSTYNEILPDSMSLILRDKLKMGPSNPPKKFYDLGSGFGKATMMAWMLGMDAAGVELADQRVQVSCDRLKKLPGKPFDMAKGAANKIRFFYGDLSNFDFSDGDVVYSDSRFHTKEMLAQQAMTARRMRPGSYIISTWGFEGSNLQDLGEITVPTTAWEDTKFRLQRVKGDEGPLSFAQLGADTEVESQAEFTDSRTGTRTRLEARDAQGRTAAEAAAEAAVVANAKRLATEEMDALTSTEGITDDGLTFVPDDRALPHIREKLKCERIAKV